MAPIKFTTTTKRKIFLKSSIPIASKNYKSKTTSKSRASDKKSSSQARVQFFTGKTPAQIEQDQKDKQAIVVKQRQEAQKEILIKPIIKKELITQKSLFDLKQVKTDKTKLEQLKQSQVKQKLDLEKPIFKPSIKKVDIQKEQYKNFKNVPKDIGSGLYEVGKEIVVFSKDAVVGSYNYGKSLANRHEQGEKTPISNDIIKIAQGGANVYNFVKNNPKTAGAIVGMAVAQGGTDFGTAFIKNPVKTTTKAAAYLFPGTIIEGGVKTAGLGIKGVKTTIQTSRLNKLTKLVSPINEASLTLSQTNKI